MNVAFDLLSRKKKVLLVDFDLEAPGLETFPILCCDGPRLGLVDYVHSYLTTGLAPELGPYVHRCTSDIGEIWIMPAGARSPEYSDKLNDIDWKDLYNNHAGFLLMENLRKQWSTDIAPDYVLIDSRTGHTDVGGICTRQLPDTIVFLFFPNEQNLYGMERIVSEVRKQSSRREKNFLFVLSNVPDLDDEDGRLEKLTNRARSLLGYRNLAATIHHYDSLALLDQEVFVISRPRAKLAGEYKRVALQIAKHNPYDRDGAIEYLNQLYHEGPREIAVLSALLTRLELFQSIYSKDPQVLQSLSLVYEMIGDSRVALLLARRSHELGTTSPDSLLRIAFLTRALESREAAIESFFQVWNTANVHEIERHAAIIQLRALAPSSLERITESHTYQTLSVGEKRRLLLELLWPGCENAAREVAEDIINFTDVDAALDYDLLFPLVLFLIGTRRFAEAIAWIDRTHTRNDIGRQFNRAMAIWGGEGNPNIAHFREVLNLHENSTLASRMSANYWQCIAISARVVGDTQLMHSAAASAKEKLLAHDSSFSAWRYLEIPANDFIADLDDITGHVAAPPRFLGLPSGSGDN